MDRQAHCLLHYAEVDINFHVFCVAGAPGTVLGGATSALGAPMTAASQPGELKFPQLFCNVGTVCVWECPGTVMASCEARVSCKGLLPPTVASPFSFFSFLWFLLSVLLLQVLCGYPRFAIFAGHAMHLAVFSSASPLQGCHHCCQAWYSLPSPQ